MKTLFLILFFLTNLMAATNTAVIFGPNDISIDLQSGIRFTTLGPSIQSGSLNPSVTPVSANAGSLYQSSTGDVYSKDDNGLTTNWTNISTGGGGGGPFSGITGPAGEIAYFDASGNGTGDSNATRDSTTQFTFIAAVVAYAHAMDDTATITFTANVIGNVGNTISLVFDGTDTITTVVNAWNVANPSNTVSFSGGPGSTVLTAQTIDLGAGGDAAYNLDDGTGNPIGIPGSGLVFRSIGGSTDWYSFSTAGDISNLLGPGRPVIGTITATADVANGIFSAIISSENSAFLVNTDSASYQSQVQVDSDAASVSYKSNVVFANRNGINWSTNGSNDVVTLPASDTATVGYNIGVTSITSGVVTLDWVPAGSGTVPSGSAEFQYLYWDTGTSLPIWTQLYAKTSDGVDADVIFGYKAMGITNSNPTQAGSGFNTAVGTQTLENIDGTSDLNTATGYLAGSGVAPSSSSSFYGSNVKGTGASSSVSSAYFGSDITLGAAPNSSNAVGVKVNIGGTHNNTFGYSNTISGTGNTSFGTGNVVGGVNNHAFGNTINLSLVSTASNNFIFGSTLGGQLTTGMNNWLVGSGGPGNVTSGSNNFLHWGGNNVDTGSGNIIFFGAQGLTSGNGNFIAGGGAAITQATGDNNILIGANTDTLSSNSSNAIALGQNSLAGSNQFVAGSNNGNITGVYFANGITSSLPVGFTLFGTSVDTSITDGTGGAVSIQAGLGTGAGPGGQFKLNGSFAGSTGNTPNTPFTFLDFVPSANTLSIGDPGNTLSSYLEVFDYTSGAKKWQILNQLTSVAQIDLQAASFVLNDHLGVLSVDVENRQAADTAGTVVADWSVTDTFKISNGLHYKTPPFLTANTTLTPADNVVLAHPASGNITITLPSGSGNNGIVFTIKRINDSTGNTVTIDTLGGAIDGVASVTLAPLQSYTLICDGGGNYWIL